MGKFLGWQIVFQKTKREVWTQSLLVRQKKKLDTLEKKCDIGHVGTELVFFKAQVPPETSVSFRLLPASICS